MHSCTDHVHVGKHRNAIARNGIVQLLSKSVDNIERCNVYLSAIDVP